MWALGECLRVFRLSAGLWFTRVGAGAIRRCGELLKLIESGQGARTDKLHGATDTKLTRTEAATQAGLSERQKVTALRVATIPAWRVIVLSDSRGRVILRALFDFWGACRTIAAGIHGFDTPLTVQKLACGKPL